MPQPRMHVFPTNSFHIFNKAIQDRINSHADATFPLGGGAYMRQYNGSGLYVADSSGAKLVWFYATGIFTVYCHLHYLPLIQRYIPEHWRVKEGDDALRPQVTLTDSLLDHRYVINHGTSVLIKPNRSVWINAVQIMPQGPIPPTPVVTQTVEPDPVVLAVEDYWDEDDDPDEADED